MIPLGPWMIERLSASLSEDDRDAVLGDFLELRLSNRQMLLELTGLRLRRHVVCWRDWHAWVALLAIVIPLGLVLSLVSKQWADGNSIYSWLYLNNWTAAYMESAGARGALAQVSGTFVRECLTLTAWAWTAGFAVGSVSRRTIWLHGGLLGVVVFAGTLGSTTAARHNSYNAAVFELMLYRVAVPALLRTLFVLLPAVSGMRIGRRVGRLSRQRALGWAAVVATATMIAAPSVRGSVMFTSGWWSVAIPAPVVSYRSQPQDSWWLCLLPLLMMGPVVYIVATATPRHHRVRSVLNP